MNELVWYPITRAEAIDRLSGCFREPEAVLDELEQAFASAPGKYAPQVRTPYRIVRWNSTLQTFETALIT